MLYSLSPEWNDSDSVFVLANEFNGLRISAAEVQQANSWQERNGSREQKGYPKKKTPCAPHRLVILKYLWHLLDPLGLCSGDAADAKGLSSDFSWLGPPWISWSWIGAAIGLPCFSFLARWVYQKRWKYRFISSYSNRFIGYEMCRYTRSLRKALADFFCWRQWLFSGKGKGKARAPPEFRQQREILLTNPGFVTNIFRHILDAGIRNVESYSSYFQTRRFFFHLESIIHGRSSQTNAKTMSNLPEVCHIIFSLRVPQSWQERNEKRLPLLGHWCLLWRGFQQFDPMQLCGASYDCWWDRLTTAASQKCLYKFVQSVVLHLSSFTFCFGECVQT